MSGEDTAGDPASWFSAKFGREPGYSDMLDMLAHTPGERRAILHGFFEPTPEEREEGLKLPTQAHRAIAELVSSGTVKVILTTNFDRLMEVALADIGIVPVVVSTTDAILGAAPLVHQRCVVVKLHGDYLDDRIKNTEAELGTYTPEMDAYLDRILDEFGLVICGWSGEWDPALRRAIERCPNRRYSTYWASREQLGAKAQKLLDLRAGHLIPIEDADCFFVNLSEITDALARSRVAHRLSTAALVSQVKKFVAAPESRVRFHDAIIDEANRVMVEFEKQYPVSAREYSDTALRARVDGYDAIMRGLRHALYHGAAWAEPENYDVLLKGVKTLLPGARQNGINVWIELSKYPAAAALYAAVLGTVDHGNWRMFGFLLDGRVRFSTREENIIDTLGAGHVLQESVAKTIENRFTPISERFLALLAELNPDQDFEPVFERMEVLIALHFLSGEAPGSKRYTVRGRFVWHHAGHTLNLVKEEIEREGDNWPPLRAGLFGGTNAKALELFNQLKSNVVAFSNRFT